MMKIIIKEFFILEINLISNILIKLVFILKKIIQIEKEENYIIKDIKNQKKYIKLKILHQNILQIIIYGDCEYFYI